MSELGPEAKALLDAVRDCDEPTLEDRARVRATIAARAVVGIAAAGATLTTAKVATAAGSGTAGVAAGAATTVSLGVAAKAIVSVTLVSAISVGAATYARWDAPKAAPVASVSDPRAPLTEPALRPIPTSDHVEAMHLTPATTPGEVPVASSRPAPVQAVVAPTASARTASDVTDVEAEVLLIGEAHSALQAGDSSRALILLDEHVRRFPAGALGEERDAARIVALCSLGRIAEAHTATERFLWAFPSSPHAARVRGSCGVAPALPF